MTLRQEMLMDLTLEIGGTTCEELAQRMTEREFRLWHVYASNKMLPARRMEAYSAQIAQVVACVMGGNTQAKLGDFFITMATANVEEVEEIDDEELAELKIDLGFTPTVWRH